MQYLVKTFNHIADDRNHVRRVPCGTLTVYDHEQACVLADKLNDMRKADNNQYMSATVYVRVSVMGQHIDIEPDCINELERAVRNVQHDLNNEVSSRSFKAI